MCRLQVERKKAAKKLLFDKNQQHEQHLLDIEQFNKINGMFYKTIKCLLILSYIFKILCFLSHLF